MASYADGRRAGSAPDVRYASHNYSCGVKIMSIRFERMTAMSL